MRFAQSAFTTLMVAAAALATITPAAQATPPPVTQVVAFSHEFTPLKVWVSPKGCVALPPGAHVIFNQTEKVITIYADPVCAIPIEPFARVKPGYGTHVSAVGSFRA